MYDVINGILAKVFSCTAKINLSLDFMAFVKSAQKLLIYLF